MKTFTSKLGTTAYFGIIGLSVMGLWFMSMGLIPYFKYNSHVSYIDFVKLQDGKFYSYTIITPLVIAIVLWYSYWNRVRSLQLNDANIFVERKRKSVTIPFSDISEIAIVPTKDIGFSTYQESTWRRSLVGFTGKYYNKNFGEMQWYCTKSKNYVLATLKDDRKIVFTPDEPEEFVNEVRRWLKTENTPHFTNS